MTKRKKVRTGDVFEIPVTGDSVGFGQVIADVPPNGLFMAVYEPLFPVGAAVDLVSITGSRVLLLANSLDAKIWHGQWRVVGSHPVEPGRFPFPAFKVSIGTATDMYVISYDGTRRVPATSEEVARLPFRTTVAPMRLENALKAHHGLGEWREEFDFLLLENVRELASIGEQALARQGQA